MIIASNFTNRTKFTTLPLLLNPKKTLSKAQAMQS